MHLHVMRLSMIPAVLTRSLNNDLVQGSIDWIVGSRFDAFPDVSDLALPVAMAFIGQHRHARNHLQPLSLILLLCYLL